MGGEAVKSGRAIPQPEVPCETQDQGSHENPPPHWWLALAAPSSGFFPPWALQQVTGECEPKNCARGIDAPRCVLAFARSFFMLLPGLRDIADKYGDSIGTRNISTISYALRSSWLGRVAEAMIRRMGDCAYRNDELAALDSMCNAISNKRRHHFKKINRQVGGVSVLWAFRVAARAGENGRQDYWASPRARRTTPS